MNPALLPHQETLVRWLFDVGAETHVVIVAPPGLGKSTAVTAFLAELNRARATTNETLFGIPPCSDLRVLILGQPSAPRRWKRRLAAIDLSHIVMDFQTYRSWQTRYPSESPWMHAPAYVAEVEIVADSDRLAAACAAPWDVIVVDDVSGVLRRQGGRQLLQRLAGTARVIALAARAVVDDDLPASAWQVFTWSRRDLAREGIVRPLADLRPSFVVAAASEEERLFADDTRALLRFLGDRPRLLWERCASSLSAAEHTLRRALELQSDGPGATNSFPAAVEDAEAPWALTTLQRHLPKWDVTAALQAIDQIESDSKVAACASAVLAGARDGTRALVVSAFADTAEYLADVLRESFETRLAVGRMSFDERQAALLDLQAAAVLVATPPGIDELDISSLTQVIHYDLGRPLGLYRRLCSLEGVGPSLPTCVRHRTPGSLV